MRVASLTTFAVLVCSLVFLPPVASRVDAVSVPVLLASTQDGMSLNERVTVLEHDAESAKSSAAEMQKHYTEHTDDFFKGQGEQNTRLSNIESKQAIFYALGGLLSSIFVIIIMPLAVYLFKESKRRFDVLTEQNVEIIKTLTVVGTKLDAHLSDVHGEKNG